MTKPNRALSQAERDIYCTRRYLSVLIEDDPAFMQEQGRLLKEFGAWMETTWGGVGSINIKDRLSATTLHYNGLEGTLSGEAKIHGLHRRRGRPRNSEGEERDETVVKMHWQGIRK